jgi:hypothetical protein
MQILYHIWPTSHFFPTHYLDDILFGGKAETKQRCNTLKVFQESCKV